MDYIHITKENLDKEHICCAVSGRQRGDRSGTFTMRGENEMDEVIQLTPQQVQRDLDALGQCNAALGEYNAAPGQYHAAPGQYHAASGEYHAALGQYKTADVDRLIRRYVKQKADVSLLREHILMQQQFHRIYFYVSLEQMKDANERMQFIHENLLFTDWWHTDQLIRYAAKLDFETAMSYAEEYMDSEDPFVRRWGYVMFISDLGRKHADRLLPLMKEDDQYYVQMAEAWLIAELTVNEPEAVYQWMKDCRLSYSICGKAIQKICDSYRISKDWKERFRALRPKWKERGRRSEAEGARQKVRDRSSEVEAARQKEEKRIGQSCLPDPAHEFLHMKFCA